MANLIPQIAKLLSVELGEEFKVVNRGGSEYICSFTLAGLSVNDGLSEYYDKELLVEIVYGDVKVVKLPWKPKEDEAYYTFGANIRGVWRVILKPCWKGKTYPVGLALYAKGWIYRTRAEAEAALPAVAKELGVDYEL